MTWRLVRLAILAALVPALASGEVRKRIDEIQITDDGVLLRAGGHTFLLDEEEAGYLRRGDWFVRDGRIILIVDDEERVLAVAVGETLSPLPRREGDDYRIGRVDIDRLEEGVYIRFHQPDAAEVYLEGTFTGWKLRLMDREEEGWVVVGRLGKGEHRFRIRYRLEGDDHWFEEPEREERLTGERRKVYVLEMGDREIGWYVEEEREDDFRAGLGAAYNRVEGLRLTYRLGLEHGIRRTARLEWSQSYSIEVERWSWEATLAVPLTPTPGLSLEVEGYDKTRIPLQWTVTPQENFAAALLIKEDFYDYVWSRGWTARVVESMGHHTLSAGYGERQDDPMAKVTDWSVFGGEKTFRENLFADSTGVRGETKRLEGRYTFDNRNYEETPTMGWYADFRGDYSGWELGGDYDYWKGVADFRHYHKLTSRVHFDFRVMGGAIQATAPRQERFFLGGVGTLRAHEFKELVGNRFFLANIEYRASVWGDLQCAFFADLGDAWDTEERRDFDLESDMGISVLGEEADVRVDLARRLGPGDDDLVVTVRFARMF
ncbi:MAG: BamA/TamA family outer membrane protein [Candidatus Eisenbacteria bacterium]